MNYKGFHQLQWEDRLVIEKMLKVGDSKAKIAEALGVCKKTIYNEIKRGWTQQMTSDYEFIWCYCPEMAERNTRKTSGPRGRTSRLAMTLTLQTMWSRKLWRSTILPQLCWPIGKPDRWCMEDRL